MKRPIIIAIEGIDGSGKTIQVDMLKNKLEQSGKSVASIDFPRYGSFFGEHIGDLLRGDSLRADQVDSKSMCLWYAMDRWRAFRDLVIDEEYLLLNRYVISNAVYQSVREVDAGNDDIWPWVWQLEHVELQLPEPDIYLLLDVETERAQENVDAKAPRDYVQGRDVYEGQSGLLSRAREKYLEIAKREENVAVIRCMESGKLMSPQSISDAIWEALAAKGFV